MSQPRNAVIRSLYRSLLRHARKIDQNLSLKFLVVAKPKVIFDRESNSNIHFNFDTHDLNNFIERFTGGGQFYRPESSITHLLQNAFRNRENEITAEETELLSTAFSALRFLADVNNMSQHLTNWSVTLPGLDKTPSENQNLLEQITDFSTVASFTGYIINKPQTKLNLGGVMREVVKKFPDLADCEVWDAGVMEGFAFLHTCPEIEGSHEVDEGVYIHPITHANDRLKIDDTLKQLEKAVKEEKTSVEHIKFLHGICVWTRTQLLSELERTVWFAMDPPAEGIKWHVENTRSGSDSINLWQTLLIRFGGEYAQIAATPDFPSQILKWLSQGQKDAFYELVKDQES